MSTTTRTPQTMDELTSSSTPRTGATKDSTLFYIGISFVLHLALLLATSYGFIFDTYIDPNGARERAAAKAAAELAATTQHATDTAAPGKTPAKPDGKTDPKSTKPGDAKSGDKPGDKPVEGSKNPADNSPMSKSLNEATPAKDIPKNADGLGLDLMDTNPKK